MSFIVKPLTEYDDPGVAVLDPFNRTEYDIDSGDYVRIEHQGNFATVRVEDAKDDEFDEVPDDSDATGIIRLSAWVQSVLEVSEGELVALDFVTDDERDGPTYNDIGGLDDEIADIRGMIERPLTHPEVFRHIGIDPPKGVLLEGPPGTGKTLIGRALANEIDASFHMIQGPEIFDKFVGESEKKLREIFEEAEKNQPAIIFIDELDALAPKRENAGNSGVGQRVVGQLLTLMNGLEDRGKVMVIGTTNRADALDPALRRGGRFGREISIGVPDETGRREILDIHIDDIPLSPSVDLDDIANRTHGYVGSDLETLIKESALNALQREDENLDLDGPGDVDLDKLNAVRVTEDDFEAGIRSVTPSALREFATEVPDVTWDDVGGLDNAIDRLKEAVMWPLEFDGVLDEMDLEGSNGVLLYGPPGTGKTLLAKAVANEADSNFISIKGPEIMQKWVGESEAAIRDLFDKARDNAPTVIFLDELDSLAPERSGQEGSGIQERVVSQLLTELSGLEDGGIDDVVVIAATNRPDRVDPALLRPGRLNRHLRIPVPNDPEVRKEILQVHTRDRSLADDVDLDDLAERTDGYTGADLANVCREAALVATRELLDDADPEDAEELRERAKNIGITMSHLEVALEDIAPSMHEDTYRDFQDFEERFGNRSSDDNDDGDDPIGFQ